nr:immunoglobulin heavy chain junction region [Mus musculus]
CTRRSYYYGSSPFDYW